MVAKAREINAHDQPTVIASDHNAVHAQLR